VKDFEMVPHTADIKIRAFGHSMEELFKHALQGMFQSIRPHSPSCHEQDGRVICKSLPAKHGIRLEAPDKEALLVDFLSQALYLSDVYNEAYFDVDIHKLTSTSIKAIVKGVKITGFDVVEIKAVTYNDLKVEYTDGVWTAEIVFDI
jgi:SHS2 domain-containing protein